MFNDFVNTLSEAIMDTLEDFFNTFTVPTGKNLKYSLLVLLGFFLLSVVFGLFGIPCFIQWYESLTAVVITGAVCLVDSGNRLAIKNLKDNIKVKIEQYKEGVIDD